MGLGVSLVADHFGYAENRGGPEADPFIDTNAGVAA